MLGKVSYAEDLGAAVIKSEKGRATVFANGQLMVIAPKEEAKKLLGKIFETILRVQMCTGCKICERSCKRGAIVVGDTFSVNENLCNRCGKCSQSCIVADQAAKMSRRFAASTFK